MATGSRNLVLERQWRERVGAWTTSGGTVREFCRRQGVTEASFHFWKRELQARDKALAVSPKPRFVPVTVLPARPVATVSVEVRCPSGHVVMVPMAGMTDLGPLFAALTTSPSRDGAVSSC
jgi:transposase-like protein